ncbi:MAG TPA: hypothetical protein VL966_12985 [Alphaproteobacteria bacterium]|jgi:hypothetical protein|nr:hypothetical protein [Alphaproteobacteria bacterium]
MSDAPPTFRFKIEEAPPILLQSDHLPRTDANSPVLTHAGHTIAFMSHYVPIGHTYRRSSDAGLHFTSPPERVTLVDDPDSTVGKWIQSVWRAPDGTYYGWYHAEEVGMCPTRLFVPHIGALVSHDRGRTWRCIGAVLRAGNREIDCGYRNGFLAGGYGDFCVVPDRQHRYFYIHLSSYVATETAQGIAVARCAVRDRDHPVGKIELWHNRGWVAADGLLPSPIWPVARGWRHVDPDSFWGPAIHYNRALDVWVMLLNRTRNGTGDIRQEGVYVSFNERLDEPLGWSTPQCLISGGVWYPEVVGSGPEDGDAQAGSPARLFMSGFSAWNIRFHRAVAGEPPSHRVVVRNEDWVRLFGPEAPGRLGIG